MHHTHETLRKIRLTWRPVNEHSIDPGTEKGGASKLHTFGTYVGNRFRE